MTLKTLVKNVQIQGDVRLSVWDSCDEVEVHEFQIAENLYSYVNALPNFSKLLRMKVKYMFAPGDGYLHIELTDENERSRI